MELRNLLEKINIVEDSTTSLMGEILERYELGFITVGEFETMLEEVYERTKAHLEISSKKIRFEFFHNLQKAYGNGEYKRNFIHEHIRLEKSDDVIGDGKP